MIDFQFRTVTKIIIYLWIIIHFIVIHHSFNEYFTSNYELANKTGIFIGISGYNRLTGNPYPFLSYEGFIGDKKYLLYLYNEQKILTKLFIKLNYNEHNLLKKFENFNRNSNIIIYHKNGFIWQLEIGDKILRENFEEYIKRHRTLSYIIMFTYFMTLLYFLYFIFRKIRGYI